jgi:hypothetical protein
MAKQQLAWENLSVAQLPGFIRDRFENVLRANTRYYDACKALKEYQDMQDCREEFENEMQKLYAAKLPHDKELKFSYNFGKLGIAVGDKPKQRALKREGSLTQWLADIAASGDRS